MNIMNEKCWGILKVLFVIIGVYMVFFLMIRMLSSLQGQQYLKSDGQLTVEYNAWLDSSLANPQKVRVSFKHWEILFVESSFIDYVSEDVLLVKPFLFVKWYLILKDGRKRIIPFWSPLHHKTERLIDTLKLLNYKLEEHIE
jgi:hypothetical protein